jgi:glycerophosphoryl diester phosphodiesterase
VYLYLIPPAAAQTRRAEGLPLIGWTARAPEQWTAVKAHCDNIIFEGFAA